MVQGSDIQGQAQNGGVPWCWPYCGAGVVTALDEFAEQVRRDAFFCRTRILGKMTVLTAARFARAHRPGLLAHALQDPRYLAYCKEQDRHEAWLVEGHGGLDEINAEALRMLAFREALAT